MKMKRSVIARFLAVSSVYLLAGAAAAQAPQGTAATSGAASATTRSAPPPGSSHVEQKLVSSFAAFAGSEENAASLVSGLRSGSSITLTGVPPAPTPGGPIVADRASFVPPTRPMGWGNVRHALTLAQRELAAQGISHPTPSQLQAALMGGPVLTSSGKTVTLQGTLALRSQGMGWGKIAHRLGVPMGHAERLHATTHHDHGLVQEARHDLRHDEHRVVTAGGHRVGAVTNASGEIIRASSHWSSAGASHARIGGDDKALSARSGAGQSGAGQTLPVASTPTASTAGLRIAADHGGLGHGSQFRGR
jgi:hypothetical protein